MEAAMDGHAVDRRVGREAPHAARPRRAPSGEESPGLVLDLQRLAGNAAVAQLLAPESGDEVVPAAATLVPGAGAPLQAELRTRMESSFGTDFSDVRIHRGPEATASAAALGARAYTIGSDVVVADGAEDERTLAHELTHVAQQRTGPVDGTDHGDGLRVSDPSDPFERAAEAAATSAVETSAPVGGVGAGSRTAPARSVQLATEDPSDPAPASAAAPAAAPDAETSATSDMAEQWQENVVDRLSDANAEFGAEPANAEGAFESTRQATKAAYDASDRLPKNDPNRDKATIVGDDLEVATIVLAPRAGHAVESPDKEIADHLGTDFEEAVDFKKLLEGSPASDNAPGAAQGTTTPEASGKLPGC
jgi:hypothetical protein